MARIMRGMFGGLGSAEGLTGWEVKGWGRGNEKGRGQEER